MKMKSRFVMILMAGTLVVGLLSAAFSDSLLGGLIKGAGVVLLVKQFGPQINDAINKLTAQKGVSVEGKTKVVPIISFGTGAYAGMAQVVGPAAQVDKVKAVAQFETGISGKTFRIKVLVPVESEQIVSKIKRIEGVGVGAVIDVRL